jgi:hypothetical protein
MSSYAEQIRSAGDISVILYDVETQIAWLVDGASALLHIVRTQIMHEPFGGKRSLFNDLTSNRSPFRHPKIDGGPDTAREILIDECNMRHVIRREFDSYAEEEVIIPQSNTSETYTNDASQTETSSSSKERKAIYKTTCLKELVSESWSTLEQLHDREMDAELSHATKQLRLPLKTTLDGYEYMAIVSNKRLMRRKYISLNTNGPGWIALSKQIKAITLFGRHFGDISNPQKR